MCECASAEGGGGRGGEVFVRRRADGDDLGARRRVGRVRGGADGTGFEIEVAEKENAAILRRDELGVDPSPGVAKACWCAPRDAVPVVAGEGTSEDDGSDDAPAPAPYAYEEGDEVDDADFAQFVDILAEAPGAVPDAVREPETLERAMRGVRGGDEIGDEKRADDDRRRRRLRVPLRRCLRRRPVRGVRGGARARSRALRPPGVHGRALGVRGVAPGRPAGDGA